MSKKVINLIIKLVVILSGVTMLIVSSTVKMDESSKITMVSVGTTLVMGATGFEKATEIKKLIDEKKGKEIDGNYGKRFS